MRRGWRERRKEVEKKRRNKEERTGRRLRRTLWKKNGRIEKVEKHNRLKKNGEKKQEKEDKGEVERGR